MLLIDWFEAWRTHSVVTSKLQCQTAILCCAQTGVASHDAAALLLMASLKRKVTWWLAGNKRCSAVFAGYCCSNVCDISTTVFHTGMELLGVGGVRKRAGRTNRGHMLREGVMQNAHLWEGRGEGQRSHAPSQQHPPSAAPIKRPSSGERGLPNVPHTIILHTGQRIG